jgi:hypothetical protein
MPKIQTMTTSANLALGGWIGVLVAYLLFGTVGASPLVAALFTGIWIANRLDAENSPRG